MGLREKVTLWLIVTAVILQTACTESKPQSMIKNPFEQYIKKSESRKNIANNVFKKPEYNGRSYRNVVEVSKSPNLYKAFNFPEVEFPSDTSHKDPFVVSSDSISPRQELSDENSVLLNSLRKEARKNRKSKVQITKDVVAKQTLFDSEQISNPLYQVEMRGFPEVEYPLSAMDAWAPKYWNPLPYNTDDPFVTDENVYKTKPKQNNIYPYIKPSSIKGNKGIFAVIGKTKENENIQDVTTINTKDSKNSEIIDSPDIAAIKKENNNSTVVSSPEVPQVRRKSKKLTKIPISRRKQNSNKKVQSKLYKPRSQPQTPTNKVQNLKNNQFVSSTPKSINKSMFFSSKTVNDNSTHVPNARYEFGSEILSLSSSNTFQLNNSSSQTIFPSYECPKDVICKSLNVSHRISSESTHEPLVILSELNDNPLTLNTEKDKTVNLNLLKTFQNDSIMHGTKSNIQTTPKMYFTVQIDSELPLSQKPIQDFLDIDTKTTILPNIISKSLLDTHSLTNFRSNNISNITSALPHLSVNSDRPCEVLTLLEPSQMYSANSSNSTSVVTSKSDFDSSKHEIKTQNSNHEDLLASHLASFNSSELRIFAEKILAQIGPVPENFVKLSSNILNNSNSGNFAPNNQKILPTDYIIQEPIDPDIRDFTTNTFMNRLSTEFSLPYSLAAHKLNVEIPSDENNLPTEFTIPNTFISSSDIIGEDSLLVPDLNLPKIIDLKSEPKYLSLPSKTSDSTSDNINEVFNNTKLINYLDPSLLPRVISDLSALNYLFQNIFIQDDPQPKNNFSVDILNKITYSIDTVPTEYVILDPLLLDKLPNSDTLLTIPNDHVVTDHFETNYDDLNKKLLNSHLELTNNPRSHDNHTVSNMEIFPTQKISNSISILSKVLKESVNKTEQYPSLFEIAYESASLDDENRNSSHLLDLYCPLYTVDQCSMYDKTESNRLDNDTLLGTNLMENNNGQTAQNISNNSENLSVQYDTHDKSQVIIQNVNSSRNISDHIILSSLTDIKIQSDIPDKKPQLQRANDLITELVNKIDTLSDLLNSETLPDIADNGTYFVLLTNETSESDLEEKYKLLEMPDTEILPNLTDIKISHEQENYTLLDIPILNTTLSKLDNGTLSDIILFNMPNTHEENLSHLTDVEILSVMMDKSILADIIVPEQFHVSNNGIKIGIPDLETLLEMQDSNNYTLLNTSHSDKMLEVDTRGIVTDITYPNASPAKSVTNTTLDMSDTDVFPSITNIDIAQETSDADVTQNTHENNKVVSLLDTDIPLVIFKSELIPNIDIDITPDLSDKNVIPVLNNSDVILDIPANEIMSAPGVISDIISVPDIYEINGLSEELNHELVSHISDTNTRPDMSDQHLISKMPNTNLMLENSDTTIISSKLNPEIPSITPDTNVIPDKTDFDVTSHEFHAERISHVIETDLLLDILDTDFTTQIIEEPYTKKIKNIKKFEVLPDNNMSTSVSQNMLDTNIPLNISAFALPDIFDPKILSSEMLNDKVIPEIFKDISNDSKTNTAVPDIHAILGLSEPRTIPNMSNTEKRPSKIPNTPGTNALPEISDTVPLIDLFDTLKLSNTTVLDLLTGTPNVETLRDITDSKKSVAALYIRDVDSSSDKSNYDELIDNGGPIMFPKIADTDMLSNLLNTNDLPDIVQTVALKDIPDYNMLANKTTKNNSHIFTLPDRYTDVSTYQHDMHNITGLPNILDTFVTLSNILNTDSLTDTRHKKDLPNISETVALPDISSTDMFVPKDLLNISDTVTSIANMADIAELSHVPDTVVLAEMPIRGALPNVPDINENIYIVPLTDVPDTNMLPELYYTNELADTDASVTLPDSFDTETSLDILDTLKLQDIYDTNLFDAPPDMLYTEKLPYILDITTLPDMPEVNKLQDVLDTETTDMLHVDELPDILDTTMLSNIAYVDEVPDVVKVETLPDMPHVDDLQNISDNAEFSYVPVRVVLPEMPKTDTLPNILNIDEVPDNLDASVSGMPDTDTLPVIVDINKLTAIDKSVMLPDILYIKKSPDILDTRSLPDIHEAELFYSSPNNLHNEKLPVIQDTTTLLDMPYNIDFLNISDAVILPNVSNKVVLQETSNTDTITDIPNFNELANYFDAASDPPYMNTLPSLIDKDKLLESSDTDELTAINKSDILSTLTLPDISDITTLPSDVDKLPNIPDTVILPYLSGTVELSEMPNTDTLPDISYIDELPNNFDTVSLSDSSYMYTLPGVPDTDQLPELNDTNQLTDIDESVRLPNIHINKSLDAPDSLTLLDIHENDSFDASPSPDMLYNERLPDSVTMPDLLVVHELPHFLDTVILPDIDYTDMLSDMGNAKDLVNSTDAVLPDISGTDVLTKVLDTNNLLNISDTVPLMDIPDTAVLTQMTDIVVLPEMPNTDTVSDTPNTSKLSDNVDTVSLPDLSFINTDILPDILDTDQMTNFNVTLLDTFEIEKLPNIPDVPALTDIHDSLDTSTDIIISNNDKLQDLLDIPKIYTSLNISAANELTEGNENVSLDALPDVW